MTTQIMIADEFGRNSRKRIVVHDTEILTQEARIALGLIERWGMVAGAVDGVEDSAGRSVMRNCTPGEVVDRACTIAENAMAEFRKRSWVISGPDVTELQSAD